MELRLSQSEAVHLVRRLGPVQGCSRRPSEPSTPEVWRGASFVLPSGALPRSSLATRNLCLDALRNDIPHFQVTIVPDDKRVGIPSLGGLELRKSIGHTIKNGMILNFDLNLHLLCLFKVVGDGLGVLLQPVGGDDVCRQNRSTEQPHHSRL